MYGSVEHIENRVFVLSVCPERFSWTRYITIVSTPSPTNPLRPLLQHRNFRLFWGGQTLSQIGTWMQAVGEGWLALTLSNRPFVVGVVSAASSFPVLLLSLYGGVVADRVDKLKLVRIAQALLLVQASLLCWFTITGRLTIPILIALATCNGIIGAFEIPGRQSFIVELVGREDLVDAIALNSGGFNLARIIGPSIAAVIIGTLGIPWCFGVNALSYLAVLASLFMIRLPPRVPIVPTQSPMEGMKEGFRYIATTPVVFTLVKVVAVNAIFGLPFLAMMPVFAREVLHTGAAGYGSLLACVGIGAFAGAIALAAIGRTVSRGRIFIASTYLFAALLILFSLTTHFAVATGLLVGIGLVMLLTGSLANGLMQSIAPDELRGRVVSAYVFTYVGLAPIGSFLIGAAADAIGVQWALAASATIMLLYALRAFSRHPELKAV